VGYDFSKEGVAAGKAEAKKWKLKNARFEVKDIGAMDLRGKFDLITALDTIHDQAKPMTVLKNIRAALKPGGDFLMMDIAGSSHLHENIQHPLGPTLYAISTLHCMTVSLAYKGEGLGTVWGEQKAQEYLKKAGFKNITVKHIEGDPMHVFFIAKK
jgi:SAM-dependent methyltransferase